MLEVRDLVVGYGKIEAVHGVSFGVGEGEVVGILGANGAGKSTILKAISGLVKPTAGSITLDGKDLLATPAYDIPRLGVAHVPEGRGLFPSLSIMDNLMLGRYVHGRRGHSGELDMVMEMFPWFKDRSHQRAGSLSGGQQQQLAIARALATKPKVLLLDEPTEGIQPSIIKDMARTLKRIRDERGLSIVVSEQVLSFALDIADRVLVIENGEIVRDDPRAGVDAAQISKYLSV
jgi:urea transport system ATP-binding protein